MSDPISEFRFENSRAEPVNLVLEPWAEEFTVPVGSTLRVAFFSETAQPIDTELTDAFLVLYAGSACRARVYLNQEEVTQASFSAETPPASAGEWRALHKVLFRKMPPYEGARRPRTGFWQRLLGGG